MTTGPKAATKDTAPGVADGSLASALSTVDTQATQRLTTLGLVYQARQSRLTRSAASITAQQGSGSAQATAAEAAVAAAKMTAARLAVVQQQVTTAAPTVAASGWALHGRVYTAQLEPAVGYCVFLVDAQKRVLLAHRVRLHRQHGILPAHVSGDSNTTRHTGR